MPFQHGIGIIHEIYLYSFSKTIPADVASFSWGKLQVLPIVLRILSGGDKETRSIPWVVANNKAYREMWPVASWRPWSCTVNQWPVIS